MSEALDTNDDGVNDGAAATSALSVTAHDVDADGLANGRERLLGTNPLRADTDGDGLSDVDVRASIDFHRKHGLQATITAVTPPDWA